MPSKNSRGTMQKSRLRCHIGPTRTGQRRSQARPAFAYISISYSYEVFGPHLHIILDKNTGKYEIIGIYS